jgi:hypothetical protein
MNWNFARNAIICISVVTLSACGSGGGGDSGSAAPAISMAFDHAKTALNQTAKLTWSTTDATSCTASGAWSGTQATSGTAAQTATTPGQIVYTLECSGPGGTSKQSATLMVALPVQKSSYENKIAAATAIGAQPIKAAEFTEDNAVAFADFFQDGTYSMVSHSLEYNVSDPTTANKLGHIHFWKSEDGKWVDHTANLLADNTGCLHARKAVVADFNADGKPDVFFACNGFDAIPFPGERPHYLLSQSDGSYKNITASTQCACHGAAAVDFNGNGYADVVVTDNIIHLRPIS